MGTTRLAPGACCGCGGCNAIVCVVDCSGAGINGASVTIDAPGGPVSGTTTGMCTGSIAIGSAGTYTTTVSATGYQTFTGNVTYTCSGTTTITLLATGAQPCQITVYGCNSCLLTGATLTIDGQTYTSSVGIFSFTLPYGGSYPYTINATRFATYSGTLTITTPCSGCSASVTLTPASGYVCPPCTTCALGAYPWPTTLYLTDSAWGSCTLTYNATNLDWEGTLTIDWTGYCACAAGAWTGIFYVVGCTGIGVNPVVSGGLPQPTQCVDVAAANLPSSATLLTDTLTAIPVDATATVAACNCGVSMFGESQCEDGMGASNPNANVIYPTGATITVTE